jgi:hypothetical protein
MRDSGFSKSMSDGADDEVVGATEMNPVLNLKNDLLNKS